MPRFGDIKGNRTAAKGPLPTEDIVIVFDEIRHDYALPSGRSKLLKTGFSARGIDELMNGLALSNPEDRKISAAIIFDAMR